MERPCKGLLWATQRRQKVTNSLFSQEGRGPAQGLRMESDIGSPRSGLHMQTGQGTFTSPSGRAGGAISSGHALCWAQSVLQFCVGLRGCCLLFSKSIVSSRKLLADCFLGIPRAGVDSVHGCGCLILGLDSPYSFLALEPWHQGDQDTGTREKGNENESLASLVRSFDLKNIWGGCWNRTRVHYKDIHTFHISKTHQALGDIWSPPCWSRGPVR